MTIKNNIFITITKLFSTLLIMFSISACVIVPVSSKSIQDSRFSSVVQKVSGSLQVLLVTNDASPTCTAAAKVYTIEKNDGKWNLVFDPIDAVIGRNGFATPGEKREGDGKTPSGKFHLQRAFGYDEFINTKILYRQVLPEDLWVDDVSSDDYNQWVRKHETTATSYEKMKRDDNLYKYGIIIEYNTSPIIKGYGSAIFFHVWSGKDKATEGCIAVSEENILRILGWLDPEVKPVIIMGTEGMI
jgi:L,D-peptidoglycan transpeptidase YkuD (ErfK/YbiS/YcfS/YnhG family)